MSDCEVLLDAVLEGTDASHFVGSSGGHFLTMAGEYVYPVSFEVAVAYYRRVGGTPPPLHGSRPLAAARRAHAALVEALT